MNTYSKHFPPPGFYVYAYLREDKTPYYIGKGKDKRAWVEHQINGKGVDTPTDTSFITILECHLTNVGALAIERRMIRWYGRKDLGTGILENKNSGGTGAIPSTATRQLWSKQRCGKKRPPRSKEWQDKIVESRRGYSHSDETRDKISIALTTRSEESKATLRGRVCSEETRAKISAALAGRILSDDTKAKMRKPKKKRK